MKVKGFTLLELLLSLSILSVSFLAFSSCLESQKQQKRNLQIYQSLYPFIEAFQWFFHTYDDSDETIEGTWLGYQTETGKRTFLKQNQSNPSLSDYSFRIDVSPEDSFYKISFFDKSTRLLASFYWANEEL